MNDAYEFLYGILLTTYIANPCFYTYQPLSLTFSFQMLIISFLSQHKAHHPAEVRQNSSSHNKVDSLVVAGTFSVLKICRDDTTDL